MIVDFHAHLSPHLQGALPEQPSAEYVSGVPAYTHHRMLADVNYLLHAMDIAGIDVAVLSSGDGLSGDPERVARANSALDEVCRRYSARLRFLAHVPRPEGHGWLREVEKWLQRCPGAAVPSTYGDVELDDPRLNPLYELLQEQGKFLWIHPALAPTPAELRIYNAYDLFRTVGREFSLVLATLRLIFGGVLDQFPRLTIIVSHLAGGLSSLVPRIRHYQDKHWFGIAHDPVHGKTASRPFDEYLERIYVDSAGFFGDPLAVVNALLSIPRRRILLGSDYPQEIRSAERLRTLVDALREWGIASQGQELLAHL